MSEPSHTQWMIDFWEDLLVRLLQDHDKFTPEAQQRLDDLAAFTKQRIRALKERLENA